MKLLHASGGASWNEVQDLVKLLFAPFREDFSLPVLQSARKSRHGTGAKRNSERAKFVQSLIDAAIPSRWEEEDMDDGSV